MKITSQNGSLQIDVFVSDVWLGTAKDDSSTWFAHLDLDEAISLFSAVLAAAKEERKTYYTSHPHD